MTNILVAIPSKNRIEALMKNTLAWVRLLGLDYKVFVEPQDYEKYIEYVGSRNIVTLPENNRGLGYSKQCIKKYALENGHGLVFKVDDDIKGFTNYRKGSKTPEETALVVRNFLFKFEDKVWWKYPEVKAIAFPYSFHMFDEYEFKPVKKVQSCYIVRTEWLTDDNRQFSTFEDFSVGLNIVAHGGVVMKYGMSGQMLGIQVGQGKGGCQDFDRMKQAEVEAGLLREIYPPLVFKKVNKPWGIEPDMRSIKL